MTFDADVVIVGGGPAGTATALALTRVAPGAAARVIVLEKARFPRDKPCAGAIGARGDALLREVGVEVDVPGVPVDGMVFRGAEGEVEAAPGRIGRVIRRVEFDHALARAVASRGVSVQDGVCVEDIRDDAADGVAIRTSRGDLSARVVVGCDGVGSAVRRSMGLGPGALRAQVVEVDTEPVPGDGDRRLLHFDASDRALRGYAWDFPTVVEGRALVCRGVYRLRGGDGDTGPDVGAVLDARLRAAGIDPRICKNKRYAERGFEPRVPTAMGARMLVGEAAGIDPVTGEGIAQAIEFGVLAGRFLARLLDRAGAGPLSLASWHDEVASSRLARDLRIRSRFAHLYYGRRRPEVERFFLEAPEALLVGCLHFAARRQDWLQVGGVVARGAARLLAAGITDALAG